MAEPRPSPQKILQRLKQLRLECLTDLEIPLPFKTLSAAEFGVACQQKWLRSHEKKFYFTPAFKKALEATQVKKQRSIPPAHELKNIRPIGKNEVKITRIIYLGTSKVGYPSLRLDGVDGNNCTRSICRGIPLAIAKAFRAHPEQYQYQVVAVDSKGNFDGMILTQSPEQKTETEIGLEP